MPDKKLTDSEIVKAWDEEIHLANCVNENYRNGIKVSLIENTLDLINRQKAELKNNENIIRLADKTIETANAEIERLKQNLEEAHVDIREHLAENEKLKTENTLLSQNSLANKYPHCVWIGDNLIFSKSEQDYDKLIANIKAEAYKEFAERAKDKAYTYSDITGYQSTVVDVNEIDGVYEELVGEDK